VTRFAWATAQGVLVLALTFVATPSHAGRFAWELGCDTVSVQPLRFRARYYIFDRFDTPLCRVRIEPIAYGGSPAYPILECTAPSRLACSVDSATGIAWLDAKPCIETYWYFGDSLSITVAGAPANFMATLFPTHDIAYEQNLMNFPCSDAATPTLRHTWGRLKVIYR
jgi:hypothetical protein